MLFAVLAADERCTYGDQMRCSKISCFLRPFGSFLTRYSKTAYGVLENC